MRIRVVCTLAGMVMAGFAADVHGADVLLVQKGGGAGTYKTIQAALDAAPEGATVRVGEGVFEGNVAIRKAVTIEGAGWEKTEVRGLLNDPQWMEAKRRAFMTRMEGMRTEAERAAVVEEAKKEMPQIETVSVQNVKGVTIKGIKIAGNAGHPGKDAGIASAVALVLVDKGGATISECVVAGSMSGGVIVRNGSEVVMSKCLVAGVWGTGIVIGGPGEPARAMVSDCDVRNCYYAGITIGRGQEAMVTGCRISGAAWHGIRYDDASPRIVGNRIFNNARCGIYASGKTAAVVDGNLFLDNEMTGISCWYGNVDQIVGNTFAGNKREGLSVLGASMPVVERNAFAMHPVAVSCGKINDTRPGAQVAGTPVLRGNAFWRNEVNVKNGEEAATMPAAEGVEMDPGFVDAKGGDYRVREAAREKKVGAAEPLAAASGWAIMAEEREIIPDGPGRDYQLWKRER